MDTSLFKDLFVGHLMPEKCYNELFVQVRFHAPCLRFVLNKIVGFWIILDTFLALLPQLLKIAWSGSAEGLSLTSFLLQLYALSCPVIYATASNFPVFAWVERLFMLAQTATIVFLILYYRGQSRKGMLVLLGYGGVMLLLGLYAAAAVGKVLHTSTIPALILSKVIQTAANHHNGHTGQLSILSLLLSCLGSLGAVIVSVQESGGSFTTVSLGLSSCLIIVLMAQVLYGTRVAVSKKME